MSVIKMTDLDLAGKRVLIRADLNVPVKDGKVTSDARIVATLPTIKLALEKGAKLMITSHLGRPTEGEYNEEFSLAPVVNYLKDALSCPVRLAKDYLDGVEVAAGELVVPATHLDAAGQMSGAAQGQLGKAHEGLETDPDRFEQQGLTASLVQLGKTDLEVGLGNVGLLL